MWDWICKTALAVTWPLVKPLVNRRMEELGQTAAVRQAVFGEMIKLRFEQYVLANRLDEHKALGMAQLVREELGSSMNFAEIDPSSEAVRAQIAREVTLRAVGLGTWAIIDQLATRGRITGEAASLRFRDANGSQHNDGRHICTIQGEFLFHKPIAYLTDGTAEVTPEVAKMAKDRLTNEHICVEAFEMGESSLLNAANWTASITAKNAKG